MKVYSNKDEVLKFLENTFTKGESCYQKHKDITEKLNQIKTLSWEDSCREAEEAYNKLRNDWWEAFITYERVWSSDKLLFNTCKISEVFNYKDAERFLKEKSEYLRITYYCPQDVFYNSKFSTPDLPSTDLKAIKVSSYIRDFKGKLHGKDQFFTVKGGLDQYLEKTYYPNNLRILSSIINKVKSLPATMKNITLEDHEIELIEGIKKEVWFKENNNG